MAWQLIYTSAPRTLTAGQSGYGTVARSAEMRDALVQRLEQLSYYSHWTIPGETSTPHPVICAYRVIDVRGSKYHLLSRIQDAGLDFTKRTNHLAHHLVFEPHELDNLPSPTIIFQRWDRWCLEWQGDPRWLDAQDWGNLARLPRFAPGVAHRWLEMAGDAGAAARLLEPTVGPSCNLVVDAGGEKTLVELLGESLRLLDPEGRSPARCWQRTFTNCLQSEDQITDFQWRGVCVGSPAWQTAQRNALPLSDPRTLTAPNTPLAELARQGSIPVIAIPSTRSAPRQNRVLDTLTAARPPQMGLKPSAASSAGNAWTQASDPDYLKPKSAAASRRKLDASQDSARRYLVAAIVIAVAVLVAGSIWLGFFRPRHPASPPPPEQSTTNTHGTTTPAGESSNALAVVADHQVALLTNGVLDTPVESRDLREQWDRQFDGIDTYLVLAGDSDNVPLPHITALEQFLARMAKENPALAQDQVECLVQANSLSLKPRDAHIASVEINRTSKELMIAADSWLSVKIAFDRWSDNPKETLWLRKVEPTPLSAKGLQSVTFTFQPKGAARSITPVRLVVVAHDASPAPIELTNLANIPLLIADQTNLPKSLHPDLWQRLRGFQISPARYELRSYLSSNAVLDLHQTLKFKFPAHGAGLNFSELRLMVTRELEQTQKILDRNQSELASLNGESVQSLQLGPASLGGYARSKRAPLTRELYLEYLINSLPRQNPKLNGVIRDLSDPTHRRKALRELSRYVTLPGSTEMLDQSRPDYFLDLWSSLPSQEKLNALHQQELNAASRIKSLQSQLDLIPADTAQVARASLFLVDPAGQRVELIRISP
jgi:hypothetical protein